jgi:methylenetetrahydrofolate dehydrogenase (NADP+)/methenyltetrahydrofolate cyclohydrolase
MELISGTKIAARIYEELTARLVTFAQKPKLHIVRANTDPASASFISLKVQAAAKLGITSQVHEFDSTVDLARLTQELDWICKNDPKSGVMLQLPLYHHLQNFRYQLLNTIPANQDVDGLCALNQGKLLQGEPEAVVPATVRATILCLSEVLPLTDLQGKHVVIVNHSSLIGRPLANILLSRRASVTVVHEFTKNLAQYTQAADILITAAGQPGLLDEAMVKENAIVLDITSVKDPSGVILGDLRATPTLDAKIAARTPVPGGIGPVTVACLMQNLVELYAKN